MTAISTQLLKVRVFKVLRRRFAKNLDKNVCSTVVSLSIYIRLSRISYLIDRYNVSHYPIATTINFLQCLLEYQVARKLSHVLLIATLLASTS